MDNVAYSSSQHDNVIQAYISSKEIFSIYKINLQQYATNCAELNSYFDDETDEKHLFRLKWNKKTDSYSVKRALLDVGENTKRSVLASLISIFDPLENLLPTLNRGKLFHSNFHKLHQIQWDTKFDIGL